MSLQKWREEREVAGKTILQLRDRLRADDRDFNSEERASWEACNKDYDRLTALIDSYERGEEIEGYKSSSYDKPGMEDGPAWGKRQRRTGGGDGATASDLALQGWLLHQSGERMSARHESACRKMGVAPHQPYFDIRLPRRPVESRAMSVGTDAAGGYTVPTGMVPSIEKALKEFNCVRQAARVIRTETGEDLVWPLCNDTGQTGELLAENTAAAVQDPAFTVATLSAYKYSSKEVIVSSELLQDNAVDLASELGMMLGERIGRSTEAAYTTGSGSSQPQGVVTGSSLGVTAAGATAITADEVIGLIHACDPAYRRSPSFGVMAHDGVLMYLRRLKDGSSRYLWEQDFTKGLPGTLYGCRVWVNQSMQATVATGTKTLLAGDFSRFIIRDAGSIRLYRMVERYRPQDSESFLAFFRTDSRLLVPTSAKPVVHLLQP